MTILLRLGVLRNPSSSRMVFEVYLMISKHCNYNATHDDVIKWKHFPHYWPFVRGIHRSTVNSPHKGQWRGALMFSLICVLINGWVNHREAGDLRRHRAHYDVTVMYVPDRPRRSATHRLLCHWRLFSHSNNITCEEYHNKNGDIVNSPLENNLPVVALFYNVYTCGLFYKQGFAKLTINLWHKAKGCNNWFLSYHQGRFS